MKTQFSKVSFLAGVSAATLAASAAFEPDRSVMNDAYWRIWNDAAQAKIDADIEKYRKADANTSYWEFARYSRPRPLCLPW